MGTVLERIFCPESSKRQYTTKTMKDTAKKLKLNFTRLQNLGVGAKTLEPTSDKGESMEIDDRDVGLTLLQSPAGQGHKDKQKKTSPSLANEGK